MVWLKVAAMTSIGTGVGFQLRWSFRISVLFGLVKGFGTSAKRITDEPIFREPAFI